MEKTKSLLSRVIAFLLGGDNPEAFEPLGRATYIELFFDLVFIFCMHSILPLVTQAKGTNADWYSYYTFWFTFALMLQIWFNSTIFMNRFGTGRVPDIVFLFTNMFLLFVMTQAISVTWNNYAIYNVCWVLISVNTMAHWLIRYKRISSPSAQIKHDTKLVVAILALQSVLVLASHPMPKNPAQVVCLVAMLLGFLFWNAGGNNELGTANREHLAERCALLMVLTFGETLVGFGSEVGTDLDLFAPVMYFLLIVGMFLIYLNEVVNLLDLGSLRGGKIYMAITAWVTFCVANVTAGFEMAHKSMTLMGVDADVYFGISVAVFLLSFFLFTPFNKYKQPSIKWTVARVVSCLLVLAQTSAGVLVTRRILEFATRFGVPESLFATQLSRVMMLISVVAVYMVLTIDRIAVRRERKRPGSASAHGV